MFGGMLLVMLCRREHYTRGHLLLGSVARRAARRLAWLLPKRNSRLPRWNWRDSQARASRSRRDPVDANRSMT
jgi:hypothetical protein